jgi:hypothetical protein
LAQAQHPPAKVSLDSHPIDKELERTFDGLGYFGADEAPIWVPRRGELNVKLYDDAGKVIEQLPAWSNV